MKRKIQITSPTTRGRKTRGRSRDSQRPLIVPPVPDHLGAEVAKKNPRPPANRVRTPGRIPVPEPVLPLRYYDAPRYWTKRVAPHLGDPELNRILVRDLNRYRRGLWGKPYLPGQYPLEVDNGDWWIDHRGPMPRFWKYAASGACHWLVNFYLRLATLAEPGRTWRIVTSAKHSTVWDGRRTLFDLNFQAGGVPAQQCWEFARVGGQMLKPGKYRLPGFPLHYTEQWKQQAAGPAPPSQPGCEAPARSSPNQTGKPGVPEGKTTQVRPVHAGPTSRCPGDTGSPGRVKARGEPRECPGNRSKGPRVRKSS